MPLMMVWADSSSRCTRKVGSSLVNLLSALEKLVTVGLVLGREGQRDDGVRDEHRGHRVLDLAVGERVARCAIDAEERDDVAGLRLLDVMHLAGVHLHETRDLDLLVPLDQLKMKSPLFTVP